MGNASIGSQVRHCLAKRREMQDKVNRVGNFEIEQYLEDETNKLRQEYERTSQNQEEAEEAEALATPTPYPEGDPMEEFDDDDEEAHTVRFVTKKDTPVKMKLGNVTLMVDPGTAVTMTPIKRWGGTRMNLSDDLKRQFLRIYIHKAEDPLARMPGGSGLKARSIFKQQVPLGGNILNKENPERGAFFIIKGEKISVESICGQDAIMAMLAFKGLSGQNTWEHGLGLVHLIDHVMEGHPRNKDELLASEDEIMELADKLSNDA